MRYRYSLIMILLLSVYTFPSMIVITGFKNRDPRTDFITSALEKYIRINLEESGVSIVDDRTEELELSILRHGNFFLASKEFLERFQNHDIGFTLTGKMIFRGRNILLEMELYSADKRRLVIKNEYRGTNQNLLAFFFHVTREIKRSMEIDQSVRNIFPVDDEEMFFKYIRYSNELDILFQADAPERYYSLLDELTSLKDRFSEFPALAELYEEVVEMKEDYEKTGPFLLPLIYISDQGGSRDNEVQRFARNLISEGYQFFYRETIQIPVENRPETVDVRTDFDIRFKRSSYNSLLEEIRRRNGNLRFANMGRYFFSENDRENTAFRDFLLNQTAVLRLVDDQGNTIAVSESGINRRQYNNGEFRNAEELPMPLTPRSSSYPAFGIKRSSKVSFSFKGLSTEDISRAATAEIMIKFD